MLGTGSAFPAHAYHSCFLLRIGEERLLVDAGGGMEILRRIEQSGTHLSELQHMFVSHVHTDHIFGAVWIIRRLTQFRLEGKYQGRFTVYGNAEVISAIRQICELTLLPAYRECMASFVDFITVTDGQTLNIGEINLKFIDVHSRGCTQFGFLATLPDHTTLAFLGDESLTERNYRAVSDVDYLISGAYCCYADREIFKPYEKHHHTVRDVAGLAQTAGAKNLILVHCEDHDPDRRQQRYQAEAAELFGGSVRVPLDMEKISL